MRIQSCTVSVSVLTVGKKLEYMDGLEGMFTVTEELN